MAHQAKKDGDVVGWHWPPGAQGTDELREVQIDTNAWKSFVHRQFFVDRLMPGSLTCTETAAQTTAWRQTT